MEIRHKTISTPDNQVDGDDWNDKHNVTPMLLGYELVEEIIAPAGSTSIIFTGLNGDEDIEYLLEIVASSSNNTSNNVAKLLFNADDGDNYNFQEHYQVESNIGYGSNTRITAIESTYNEILTHQKSKLTIYAKSGTIRMCEGKYVRKTPNHLAQSQVTAYWNNTTSIITSITIAAYSPFTFSGTFRLWKRIKEVS